MIRRFYQTHLQKYLTPSQFLVMTTLPSSNFRVVDRIFWDYYRELLAYKDAPSAEAALPLKSKFWLLFTTKSGYELLNERQNFNRQFIALVSL
ncbi:hypothetical protein QUA13_18260 [Microcoleus sp. S28C3]|uniref:hypothetical protein n=1 Tax=Microcoleus sp. S28C3 TaxID=3055414 RepID=UPI002FCF7F2E